MPSNKQEIIALLKLSSPVFIASVAQTGMGVVDTLMAGGVSANDMAAVSIAASLWLPTILFGVGLLMAQIPVIASLFGAEQEQSVANTTQQGIYMALLLSVPIIGVLLFTPQVLLFMQVDETIATITNGYMYAILFSVPAFLLFQALRNLTDGASLTKPAMVIGFIGLLLNIPLNGLFVYGFMGVEGLGGIGCGIATAIVYWVMLFLLFGYICYSRYFKQLHIFSKLHPILAQQQWQLFALGVPVAAAIFFEVTLFAVVSLLIAPLGAIAVAAHQIAINFSTMVFMLPMSIGAAASIRVGHHLGAKRHHLAITSAKMSLMLAIMTAVLTAATTIFTRQSIAAAYTDNQTVIDLATQLLILAGVYQCMDAIQVVSAGALKGHKDTKAIFYRTFFSFWVVGLPIGYVLALTDWVIPALGAKGFWYGFILGLSSAAFLLAKRLIYVHKTLSDTHTSAKQYTPMSL
ncbi:MULTISPECIES: MATE family efflux transporter [unclassified Vibrio]|uniref:Multidrug resistance protein NorM n=1 Tax=Vibrio sp. HB236076 TaxID=3232307 RepID=A0AB39HCA3_9VIBR|nr:MATE family efflux transporter [Vibrio sp. HB161653]MDP5253426.1 MATE family efflux transporter [Vibrio sp. HB161653]